MGQKCLVGADCTSMNCVSGQGVLTCAGASCLDNIKNGNETDKDCGGTCPSNCATTKACLVNSDCVSDNCVNSFCEL